MLIICIQRAPNQLLGVLPNTGWSSLTLSCLSHPFSPWLWSQAVSRMVKTMVAYTQHCRPRPRTPPVLPCWLWSQAVPRVAVTTTTCTSAAAAALVAAALILTVSPVFAADEEDAAGRIKAAVCASNPTSELCVKDSFKPVGPQPRS